MPLFLELIRDRSSNSPRHLFYYLISLTLLFADYRKRLARSRNKSVALCVKRLNSRFLTATVAITLCLIVSERSASTTNSILWKLIVFASAIYAFWRCNEIFIAFVTDATSHLQPPSTEPTSGLKYYERIGLALRSYVELVLDYALVYRGLFELLCGGFSPSLDTTSAVYFSGITIMTIGYGDIQPTHWLPRLMSLYEAMNGIALIVISFTVYVSRSVDKKEFLGDRIQNWKKELVEQAVDQDIALRVGMAVEELLERDQSLFQLGANERAISHRLGIYLDPLFRGWHVDCEYNRIGHQSKRVETDAGSSLVLPDVIVHRRNTTDNLLAIEVKISPTQEDVASDVQKLRAIKHDLNYIHVLFLGFDILTNGQIQATHKWVID